jgi:hypothetical protein
MEDVLALQDLFFHQPVFVDDGGLHLANAETERNNTLKNVAQAGGLLIFTHLSAPAPGTTLENVNSRDVNFFQHQRK